MLSRHTILDSWPSEPSDYQRLPSSIWVTRFDLSLSLDGSDESSSSNERCISWLSNVSPSLLPYILLFEGYFCIYYVYIFEIRRSLIRKYKYCLFPGFCPRKKRKKEKLKNEWACWYEYIIFSIWRPLRYHPQLICPLFLDYYSQAQGINLRT